MAKVDCTATTEEEITQKYAGLRAELAKLASGFAAIARTLESGDLDVAEDLVKVFEAYSCDVLEKHDNP